MKPKMYLVNLRSRSDKFIFFVHECLIDWIDSVEINNSSESVIIPDNILNTHLAENPTAEVIKSSFMMSRINGFNDFLIHIVGSSKNYESIVEAITDGENFEIIEEIEGLLY